MSNNWIERADKVVMHTYGRLPLVLVKGQGCRVWDDAGKEYLDFVAGLAVCNLGHAHPAVAKAAAEQLTQLVHVSNLYYTTPMVELAELLVRKSPLRTGSFSPTAAPKSTKGPSSCAGATRMISSAPAGTASSAP